MGLCDCTRLDTALQVARQGDCQIQQVGGTDFQLPRGMSESHTVGTEGLL